MYSNMKRSIPTDDWSDVAFWVEIKRRIPADQTAFERKMQIVERAFLRTNHAAQKAMAENYVGLP